MDINHSDFDQLIAAAKAGDGAAMERLLMRLHAPLLKAIRRYVRETKDLSAEDILQETLVSAFRHFQAFDDRGGCRIFSMAQIHRAHQVFESRQGGQCEEASPGGPNHA